MALPQILRGRTKFRFPWSRTPSKPILTIPIDFDSSADFTTKIAALFLNPNSRIYIDTSFLMWLTKISSASRNEFFEWARNTCPGRICVPVWSAHEYLRHHISKTILNELDARFKELAEVAGKTYGYLRPFMDEPLRTGIVTREAQLATARGALNELQLLAADTKTWRERYGAQGRNAHSTNS